LKRRRCNVIRRFSNCESWDNYSVRLEIFEKLIVKLARHSKKQQKIKDCITSVSKSIYSQTSKFDELRRNLDKNIKDKFKKSPVLNSPVCDIPVDIIEFKTKTRAFKDSEIAATQDIWDKLERLSDDFNRVLEIIDAYFQKIQDDLAYKGYSIFSFETSPKSVHHNKSIELTSKAKKEMILIELQLDHFFKNIECDLKTIFVTLNNFYEHN
jgi:hypothetical protein